MKVFLAIMAMIGAIVPMVFFARYFSAYEFSISHIFSTLFANPLNGGFTADLLISAFIFLVWTLYDLRDEINRWFILLIATCIVGLSLSLPLYLLFKYSKKEKPQE